MNIIVDIDLRDRLDAARNQGTRPTCIAFAVSSAHEFKRGSAEYLSTEYLFYNGSQRTHKDPEQGLTRTAVRDALLHDGQPLETLWPYLDSAPSAASWSPPALIQAAHKATIDFTSRTVAEVRSLVKTGTPVVLIVMATVAMYSPGAHGIIRTRAGDMPTSRHALVAVGSGHANDGEYLLVRNSWGQRWGQAGHAWLHDPYIAAHLEITGTIS